jgi:hypothetical protein
VRPALVLGSVVLVLATAELEDAVTDTPDAEN